MAHHVAPYLGLGGLEDLVESHALRDRDLDLEDQPWLDHLDRDHLVDYCNSRSRQVGMRDCPAGSGHNHHLAVGRDDHCIRLVARYIRLADHVCCPDMEDASWMDQLWHADPWEDSVAMVEETETARYHCYHL